MSLASKVLVGLVLGIIAGVVAGERTAFLGGVGRGFILLLQMAVLPFVSVSLIAGLGGLNPGGARSLVRYAGGFLLLIWGAVLLIVLSTPLAFPKWPAASYFSAALVEERAAFDFIGSYIPANPFRSLADGVVPAVVFFSVAFGLALMTSDRKAVLLDVLLAAQDALRRVTSAVIRLAPYGLFAIAAEASGTMVPGRLAGLQVYVVTYVILSLLLAFWVLPALVAAVTPISYRTIVGASRDALVTAFATGSLFIVLPILDDRARTLLAERNAGEEAGRQVNVVVPIAFTLAGAGKLLGLVFVLYAGWQSGFPISPLEYPEFAVSGLFSSFAASAVSLPFMLDLVRVPSDMFQLYLVVDSVIGGRFSALAGSMNILALALIAGCGTAGWVRVRPRQLAVWGLVSAGLTAVILIGIRVGFERFDRPYEGYQSFIDRSFLLPTVAWRDSEVLPELQPQAERDGLSRIRARGVLRVAYGRDRLPYAFRNRRGELVGFDVEMAHALARDLEVDLEFYRTDGTRYPELLDSGLVDVVMSGVAITPDRLERMNLSSPSLQETLAFVVRDHRRDEFRRIDVVQAATSLRLAVAGHDYYARKIRSVLPNAEITSIDSPRVFFRAPEDEFDALVFAAEAGSAWTLIYPQFTVAVPHPFVLRVPTGYATARDDRRMADFIDRWVVLKRSDRTIDRLFGYWFEGKEPAGRQRRWSLARDVFGWDADEETVAPQPGRARRTPEPQGAKELEPAAREDVQEPGEPGASDDALYEFVLPTPSDSTAEDRTPTVPWAAPQADASVELDEPIEFDEPIDFDESIEFDVPDESASDELGAPEATRD